MDETVDQPRKCVLDEYAANPNLFDNQETIVCRRAVIQIRRAGRIETTCQKQFFRAEDPEGNEVLAASPLCQSQCAKILGRLTRFDSLGDEKLPLNKDYKNIL